MPQNRLPLIFCMLFACSQGAQAREAWQFRLSPYIWFAGLEGDLTTIPGAPAAPIDVSASDALDDTEASLMFIFDAKRGRHGIFADFFYTDVRSDEELVPQPIGLLLRSETDTTILSVAYQYAFIEEQNASLDLMLGARYWHIDSDLKFREGQGLLAGLTINNDEDWLDPFVGAKGRLQLGESNFFLAGGVGAGGFGVSSDLFYEVSAVIGYRWSASIETSVGYRMFDVDYDDGYQYDARQEGWQVGLTWAF